MKSEKELQEMLDNTPESDYVKAMRNNANNISKWLPRVEGCGFNMPKTVIFQTPQAAMDCCYEMNEDTIELLRYWVKRDMLPVLEENHLMNNLVFVKNGTFSYKFSFNEGCSSIGISPSLALSIFNINYFAELFGAGGQTEIAVRERIGVTANVPKIYNGMKLFPEYRVFYDFKNHKLLYVVNYWDYDYCYENIAHDVTDGIVYKSYYPMLLEQYNEHFAETCRLSTRYLANVDMEGLYVDRGEPYDGAWSVDIMYVDGKFWLTDMATAYTSAYWNPSKVDKF